jgi:hypothetical protein
MNPRRLTYCTNSTQPDAQAERGTRQADEQDAYGYRRPVIRERVANEDRTLTGGYLNEEVTDAIRTGRARNTDVAHAARMFATPWLLDEPAALPE